MTRCVVELPVSPSIGDFGEDVFERFLKELVPTPVRSYSRVPVSKRQGVKTPDFTISLKCACSPLAVEVKTMAPRRSEMAYAAGKAPVINRMEHVAKLRHLISDANAQLTGQWTPGVLVVMTGPDDRACLPLGSGLSAIDMAMEGNHVYNARVPDDRRDKPQFSHWSRDEGGARTREGLNAAISAVMLLNRQWHSRSLWDLRLVGLRNRHADSPVCRHFDHDFIHLAMNDEDSFSECRR